MSRKISPDKSRTSALLDVLTLVQWGPKTRAELAAMTGLHIETVSTHLRRLRVHGLVYRCGYTPHPTCVHHKLAQFAANRLPFEQDDAE